MSFLVWMSKSAAPSPALLSSALFRATPLTTSRVVAPAASVLLRRALTSRTTVRSEVAGRATSGGVVPLEDYYEGHLMADHLEFLDDMMEKATELEESLQSLRDSHERWAQQQQQLSSPPTVKWMESGEIDQLLEPTRQKTVALQRQLSDLRKLVASARRVYAVDAPDGVSDAEEKAELRHVQEWVEAAAGSEDAAAILQVRADGAKTVAVDAPDGEPDGRAKEELAQVKRIVDEAAVLEDAAQIQYKHRMEAGVMKDRVRDPEHDW